MSDVFDRIVGRATTVAAPVARLAARREPRFAESPERAEDGGRGDGDHRDEAHGDRATGRAQHREDRTDGRPEPGTPSRGDPPLASGAARARAPEPQQVVPARREAERDLAVPPADQVPGLQREPSASGSPPSRPARQPTGEDRLQVEVRPPPDPLRVRARRTDPAPAPGSAGHVVSAEELLRDHVAPALAAQGAVSLRAAEHLTARGLDQVEVPAGGDVHVHIGTVELRQPETTAPRVPEPTEAGRTPDRVDHRDYLERQQRRWS